MRIEKVSANKRTGEEWFARNAENNRNLSKGLVNRYANDMRTGNWKRNSETIKFDRQGRLVDGQHRVAALIQADVTVEFDVAYDLDETVIHTIDQGRARSASDALHMNGFGHSRILAGSAKAIMNYLENQSPQYQRSTPEINQFVGQFPTLQSYTPLANELFGKIPPSPVAAVLFLASADGRRTRLIPDFIDGLKSGANLDDGDPRLALRDTISSARVRASVGGTKALDLGYVFQVTARAWNAYAENRPITIARYSRSRKTRKLIIPDIVGGPRVGAGIPGLRNMMTQTTAARTIAAADNRTMAS